MTTTKALTMTQTQVTTTESAQIITEMSYVGY